MQTKSRELALKELSILLAALALGLGVMGAIIYLVIGPVGLLAIGSGFLALMVATLVHALRLAVEAMKSPN